MSVLLSILLVVFFVVFYAVAGYFVHRIISSDHPVGEIDFPVQPDRLVGDVKQGDSVPTPEYPEV